MKKILQIILISSCVLFAQIVFANPFCRAGFDKMVQSLNLDPNQKTQIAPILRQLKQQLQNSGEQMGDLNKQINQEANSAPMNQAKVNDLVDKQTKLIGNMIKAKITAKNQIFSILNPKQKEKLQERVKEQEQKMAEKYKKCDND